MLVELGIVAIFFVPDLLRIHESKPMLSMLAMGAHLPAMMLLSAFGREVSGGFDFALVVLIGWLQCSLLVGIVGMFSRKMRVEPAD